MTKKRKYNAYDPLTGKNEEVSFKEKSPVVPIVEREFWLAELKPPHDSVNLLDGPHSERSGAEQAFSLFHALRCIKTEGRKYRVAEVILTEPVGDKSNINFDAVNTLNGNL
jgi:hypothetical protein